MSTENNNEAVMGLANGNEPSMKEIRERYLRLYGGLIFDVLEHLGYPYQAVSHQMVGLTSEMKLAGPAFTVKGTMSCEKDESKRYKRLAMIKNMSFPCVEVRDAGTPFHVAIYGELSATTAQAHGAVGALIDGGTRDSSHLVKMGFPVFARYRNPVEAFGRWMMLEYQVPIRIRGELIESVIVQPGDFIFGDLDGVIVIPQSLTLQVLEECERIMNIEDVARGEFARGDDPVAVFERHKRL
ncbi:MAG: RraA family protein [Bryobacterales bacterium]|jgi:regulator of RNase E activity RraA|nr:RraA family protein [Bryobacterales bacterium]